MSFTTRRLTCIGRTKGCSYISAWKTGANKEQPFSCFCNRPSEFAANIFASFRACHAVAFARRAGCLVGQIRVIRCLPPSPCLAGAFAKAGIPKAKPDNPPGAKEFETRMTRILTNRMNLLVEIGAIRVHASSFFASFRVFRGQTSDLLRIIHVHEFRFQIRLIRVIRGLSRRPVRSEPCAKTEASWRRRTKNQSFRKIFGNFVQNFRERVNERQTYQQKTTTRKKDISP
jgi:hypothetical protein